jgi:MtN3 and saliva related transmembrane protein
MDTASWIGGLAAIASVASFTPQAWRIIKDRRTDGLSAAMYVLTCVGFSLWTSFGVLKGEWAIIVPNSICLALSAFILVLILLPPQKTAAVAEALDVTAAATGDPAAVRDGTSGRSAD